ALTLFRNDTSAGFAPFSRRTLWLVSVLLAGHSLFLIVGYARGIVPLLTERYLVIDLPLVAALMSSWVVVWSRARLSFSSAGSNFKIPISKLAAWGSAFLLIAASLLRFQDDLPEL